MKVAAYILSGVVLGAGVAYSFIDLTIGLLVVLISGTITLAIANDIKKDWNDRE